jgi:hypothetical protein
VKDVDKMMAWSGLLILITGLGFGGVLFSLRWRC